MMFPASFFDIDGTLVKGFLMTGVAHYLHARNLFSERRYAQIERWLTLFQEKHVTYRQVVMTVPAIYGQGLKNRPVKTIRQEARQYVDEVMATALFPYTLPLVKMMKSYGMTVGISGAPSEVVDCLGKHFAFDTCYGSTFEVKQGRYTGRLSRNLTITEAKETIFQHVLQHHQIDLATSFGFGDTEQDTSILSRVGYPVALNPNQALGAIAQQKG
jgi:HAD superfamily hydrolase (TIGR01490 family)